MRDDSATSHQTIRTRRPEPASDAVLRSAGRRWRPTGAERVPTTLTSHSYRQMPYGAFHECASETVPIPKVGARIRAASGRGPNRIPVHAVRGTCARGRVHISRRYAIRARLNRPDSTSVATVRHRTLAGGRGGAAVDARRPRRGSDSIAPCVGQQFRTRARGRALRFDPHFASDRACRNPSSAVCERAEARSIGVRRVSFP